ncbi:MAG: hypothetical protein ACXABY_14580 [Candidatus Thorarchaeota archaeon]|jgi:hypothetical protein
MRHLVYHIYADGNKNTIIWHMLYLQQFIHVFDNKIIKITTDDEDEARKFITPFFKGEENCFLRFYDNDPALGETVGFKKALETIKVCDGLEAADRSLTFVASANGVSREGKDLVRCIKAWSKAMYYTTLGNIPRVTEALRNKYHTYGSFMRVGHFNKGGHRAASWHYSGLFYWMRNDILFSRDWDDINDCRHAIEMYPGTIFDKESAYCAFNTPQNMYFEEVEEVQWINHI